MDSWEHGRFFQLSLESDEEVEEEEIEEIEEEVDIKTRNVAAMRHQLENKTKSKFMVLFAVYVQKAVHSVWNYLFWKKVFRLLFVA